MAASTHFTTHAELLPLSASHAPFDPWRLRTSGSGESSLFVNRWPPSDEPFAVRRFGRAREQQNTRSSKSFGINARDGGRTRTPLAGLRILTPVYESTICDETLIKQFTYSDLSPTERVKKYESFSFATGQKQANKNRQQIHVCSAKWVRSVCPYQNGDRREYRQR